MGQTEDVPWLAVIFQDLVDAREEQGGMAVVERLVVGLDLAQIEEAPAKGTGSYVGGTIQSKRGSGRGERARQY